MSERINEPPVTLIIPAYNEAARIEVCLQSVLGQDYPDDRFKVLVVDGGGADGRRDQAAGLAAAHPQVRLVENPRCIQAAALKLGVREAKGEVIIRLDAHARFGIGGSEAGRKG